ncbi:MAG: hypothetical protein IPP99_12775 [Chitinophagaceae bacterium]|nr:hypothetical protein [Chitinophagaceae bacterium]
MKNPVPAVWLLANLIHPVILMLWFNDGILAFKSEDIGIGVMIFIYAFLFSIPSLLFGLLAEYIISGIVKDAIYRYLFWLCLAPLLAVLNWVLVALLFDGGVRWMELSLAIPSMIAVLLASLMRYRSFLKQESATIINENEAESVS